MAMERHNRRQIEMLNQRGGRTLSIVDLIGAGTISVEMAAYSLRAMQGGASLLTGARPGGAGKTTLMAAILDFLPPNVPIVTVDDSGVIRDALRQTAQQPRCYLAHEIGAGSYYGYIWGSDVADFLSLIGGPRRIASCLHADTIQELTGILRAPPLNVPHTTLGKVGLILFMHIGLHCGSYRRRVATFHEADGRGGHELLFRWEPESDSFQRTAELDRADELRPYVLFLQRLVEEKRCDCNVVRREVVEFYRRLSGH